MRQRPDLPIGHCDHCGEEIFEIIELNTGRKMLINVSNGRNHRFTCLKSLRSPRKAYKSRAGWRQKAADSLKRKEETMGLPQKALNDKHQ